MMTKLDSKTTPSKMFIAINRISLEQIRTLRTTYAIRMKYFTRWPQSIILVGIHNHTTCQLSPITNYLIINCCTI